jgi:hypothetical protein
MTIMLYASIFLVVVGIVLIVYSFVTKAASSTKGVAQEAIIQPVSPRFDGDAPSPDTNTKVERKADAGSSSQKKQTIAGVDKIADGAVHDEKPVAPTRVERVEQKAETAARKKEQSPSQEAHEGRDTAVLYVDASGVVDYEGGQSVIDPSFKKYAKLKRVGSGHVSVVNDGIHFQLRKKLYRFEFYLVDKMVQGENYLALFLKNSSEARLFIFKRGSGIEKRLAREYAAYRKTKL